MIFFSSKGARIFIISTVKLCHWPSEYSVRQRSRRPGFNPRSRHTKDFKNGT